LQFVADAPFRAYKSQLEKSRSEVQTVLDRVDNGLNHLKQLGERHTFVSTKSNALHTACQHLLEEQESLSELSEEVIEWE